MPRDREENNHTYYLKTKDERLAYNKPHRNQRIKR